MLVCLQSRTATKDELCLVHRYAVLSLLMINACIPSRVRTILVLGYWVVGNIHRYWIVLLLGDIFCCSDTQYNTNQTAVSTVHIPVNGYLVLLLTCTFTNAVVCLDTTLICCCLLNTINHCHHHRVLGFFVVIAMLYTSIGIGIGYWYR